MSVKPATIRLPDSDEIYDIISLTEPPTPPVGSMTSNEERLLKVVRLFGTPVGRIVLVVLLIALGVSFLAGIRFDQSRYDVINFEKRKFQMVGVASVPEKPDLFIPVYKDSENLMRQARGGQ